MAENKNRTHRSLGSTILEFLGSMNLAITLLIVLAVASVIGTVLQQSQPYQDYQIKFGPFWFEVFRVLGLYDVYGAIWFLLILTFLVLSVSVCVWRHTPSMLREMRHFRLDPQLKSLKSMRNSRSATLDEPPEKVAERAEETLREAGYRIRRHEKDDHLVVAGMRGGANRIGYILAHVSIVVICVGALIDGNVALKIAEMTGRVSIETRDIPASEVPPESTLGPETAAFRGNVTIPEGAGADLLFLNMRNGYFVQKLPFRVELEEFRVKHYPSGKPKSFESDIVVHDPELDEPLRKTISVNDPLVHRGISIYQASFEDGGSELNLTAIPLSGSPENRFPIEGVTVRDSVTISVGERRLTMELRDFEVHNVESAPEGSGSRFRNYGPSFTYVLREDDGSSREFETFMLPAEFDGRHFYVSGMREASDQPMRWLHLPANPRTGGLDRFLALRGLMMDGDRVRDATEGYVDQRMGRLEGEQREATIDGATRIVAAFNRGGIDGVMRNVERMAADEREAERMGQLYRRILDGVASRLYNQVLESEGIEVSGRDMAEEDINFYSDAIEAMAALPRYGAPFFLELEDFDHRQASGLQIAKAPGENVVYLGSLLLVVGLFQMFYVAHRRVWVRLDRSGNGTEGVIAGSTNRHPRDFSGEFEKMAERVVGQRPSSTDGA
ncbi:MAG: cytochrome c biogenesis protein ResB [Pseudomonadota bacterium]